MNKAGKAPPSNVENDITAGDIGEINKRLKSKEVKGESLKIKMMRYCV